MIAKITKGRGYRGLVDYLHQTPAGKRRGQVLATNFSGTTPREWAKEFGLVRRLRPTLGKAVFHASLSPSPDDPPLTDEEYGQIARHFMNAMGFPEDAPYVVIRHEDQSHSHIHIAASRITPTGEVVSDARDFQRAEAIVREIESARGLRAVPLSRTTRKRKPQRRKGKIMADAQVLNPLDGQAEEIQGRLAAEAAEPWDAEKHTAERRRLLDDAYRNALHERFGEDVVSIRRNRTGPSLHIKYRDGVSLHDYGARMNIDDRNPISAARRLVAAAVAKGWTAITFRGKPEFVKEAMREAMANGIRVVPTDEAQMALLAEVLEEQSGVGGAVAPQPAPAPAPTPAPTPVPKIPSQINVNKLAAMRQRNPKSGPKMRRR